MLACSGYMITLLLGRHCPYVRSKEAPPARHATLPRHDAHRSEGPRIRRRLCRQFLRGLARELQLERTPRVHPRAHPTVAEADRARGKDHIRADGGEPYGRLCHTFYLLILRLLSRSFSPLCDSWMHMQGRRDECFSPERDKILCSELKHLYMVLTRAKRNLWMYDSGRRGFPLENWWRQLNLVSFKTPEQVKENP